MSSFFLLSDTSFDCWMNCVGFMPFDHLYFRHIEVMSAIRHGASKFVFSNFFFCLCLFLIRSRLKCEMTFWNLKVVHDWNERVIRMIEVFSPNRSNKPTENTAWRQKVFIVFFLKWCTFEAINFIATVQREMTFSLCLNSLFLYANITRAIIDWTLTHSDEYSCGWINVECNLHTIIYAVVEKCKSFDIQHQVKDAPQLRYLLFTFSARFSRGKRNQKTC